MKHKILSAAVLTAALLAASCSSGESDSSPADHSTTATTQATTPTSGAAAPTASAETDQPENPDEVSVVVPFTAANGRGTVTVSGVGSPVVVWFAGWSGEVSLDLVDADVDEPVSVVEGLVGFWFFTDDNSGDTPPSIYVSAGGVIMDSLGSRYVVEAEGLSAAPGTEAGAATTSTTAASAAASSSTTSTTASAASSVPTVEPEPSVTSEPPSTTSSSTTTTASPPPTTSSSTTTTTSTTVVESPVTLQVQVLNGSGVAGAAGRLTDRLSEAGYSVLPASNAPERYSSSAVYFAEGWEDKAEEILETADIEEIDGVTAMPQQFASEDAAVVVLLGTDTAPAVIREQAGLRPRPNFDVKLPLGDDVPRDRFVPGLADIQIYTPQNDADPTVLNYIDNLQRWLRYVANYREDGAFGVWSPSRGSYENLLAVYDTIEEIFDWLGFTPQNVCGAPAGYSFTDLLKPTREFSEETQSYRGDAIFTTDRLLELHGGQRINPETNLDFYIRQAVQTAYDALRLPELLDETEAPQLVLCRAFLAPSGEVPEFANGAWYALLTPGIQPRESLLSQGTYHFKEISRNGNKAWIWICHPTLGARGIGLHWRETGYRAEVHGDFDLSGCQAAYEAGGYTSDVANEDVIKFTFGERVFSASDLLEFPRG